MKLKYVAVYEQGPNSYSAYLPDLPGCACAGETWPEIQDMLRKAVLFHIEGMLECGEPLPGTPMSLEEAMACHSEPLFEDEKEAFRKLGNADALLSATFASVSVEVEPAAASVA